MKELVNRKVQSFGTKVCYFVKAYSEFVCTILIMWQNVFGIVLVGFSIAYLDCHS
jgi:hypothetical protein